MSSRTKVLVVIAIAMVSVGSLGHLIGRNRAATIRLTVTRARLAAYAGACAAFHGAANRWPTNLIELRSNAMITAFIDPREPEVDGWGHPVELVPPSTSEARMILRSLGADRRAGGSGLDADPDYSWSVSFGN